MRVIALQDMRFLGWGWPEASLKKGEEYEAVLATNLPDHDYFVRTMTGEREDWVPVTADEVEVRDDEQI